MQDQRQRPFRPYRCIIFDEASQVAFCDMNVLFENIYPFLLPGNIDGLCPSMVDITDKYQLGPHTRGPPSMY